MQYHHPETSNKYRFAGLWLAALLGLSMPCLPLMAGPDDRSDSRTAVARQAMEWDSSGKPSKLEFDFGDFRAWGRRDGSWNIEGKIQHRGLLCATYTLSVRAGHGEPGCTNPSWYSEPRVIASTRLCNNASGTLSGGDIESASAEHFDDITCAERTVTCSGNCK